MFGETVAGCQLVNLFGGVGGGQRHALLKGGLGCQVQVFLQPLQREIGFIIP